MELDASCTICGSLDARLCAKCRSAAYCSVECQQTDWRAHRLLCHQFSLVSAAGFAARPSAEHYLAIYFPMKETKPSLVWIGTKVDQHETEEYIHPDLDRLLVVPGHQGYIGRALHWVRGNILRGRKANPDTVNIWYLDPDVPVANLITNQTLHGTIPTLIGDTWGEMIWKGPMVVVVREGNAFDPHRIKDVTLTAYRDAIDFLGYYIDTCGSMIDGIGASDVFAKRVMEDRAGKIMGWRLNCVYDQVTLGQPDMVSVAVPKAHPLFNLEGDDPLEIPSILGFTWVARAYNRGGRDATELENDLARLLLLRTKATDGKWEGLRSGWNDPAIGSVLIVEGQRREVKAEVVRAVYDLIKDVVLPLMTEERALQPDGEKEIINAITKEGQKRLFMSSR